MYFNRSFSAPPVDKFISENENVEIDDIKNEIMYSTYYKRNKNPRLDPPKYIYRNFTNWTTEYNDFLSRAFSEKKTAVEMIDLEFPDSDGCSEFSGKSRTTTPVGNMAYEFPDLIQKSETTSFTIPISCSTLKPDAENLIMKDIKAFYDTMCLEPTFNISEICVAVCKDQEGSRHIQGLIDSWDSDQISFFFDQILSSSLDLSTNLFGNYVIQKIIPFLDEKQSFNLILQFFGHIYELSLHVYGCRVIQKLIDHMDEIKSIIAELECRIGDLIASPNGNHVVQKCIEKDIDKSFLLKEFENDCIKLSQQRYGCRVLQRLFEVCSEDETWNIYLQIIKNIDVLINDKYGNYVIQHLIESSSKLRNQIFEYIISNSFLLSKDKFSSNVVEKCVNNCSKEQLELLLIEFSKCPDGVKPCLFYMCTDMYANYVVQRFFDVADENLRNKAKTIIRPFIKDMRTIPFTKHILTKLI